MAVADKISDLAAKITELYKELVTNTARFEHLEKYTRETLEAFKGDLRALTAKVDNIQIDHIRQQADLRGSIKALEGRLDMLSEEALHVVTRNYVQRQLGSTVGDSRDDKDSRLPTEPA